MGYYVYMYVNPLNEEIFYVGKGTKNRYLHHLKRKDNHPFVNKIFSLTKIGILPNIIKIECSTEKNAYDLEIGLIKLIGRKENNTGSLLNLTEGGEKPPKRFGKNNHFYGKKPKKCDNRKGVKLSVKTKNKISNSLKGRAPSTGMLNKKHNLDSIEKIKLSNYVSSVGRGKTWKIDEATGKRIWVEKQIT